MDTDIKFKDVAIYIGKYLIFFVKISCREVCNHPFLVVFVLFSYLLHNLHPGLFSFLVNSAPVITCTMLLLGTLVSYGDPHIPKIGEEGEMEFNHIVSKSSLHKTTRDLGIMKEAREKRQVQVGEEMIDYSGWDFTNILGNIWRSKGDDNPNIANCATSVVEKEYILEMHDDERMNKEGNEGASKVVIDHSMVNEGVDLELSDTDQDRHGSNASMSDIIPMLEELHPLLDSDLSEAVHIKIDDSDDTAEMSSEDLGSYYGSADFNQVNENEEDDEQVSEEKDDDGEASAMAWTAYDLNNVLDLGNSELERNERLEEMIVKQKTMRRSIKVENLLDQYDSQLKISPVCTTKQNPFDDHNGSQENTCLPPIPDSAPPILYKLRSPSDDFSITHANDGDIDEINHANDGDIVGMDLRKQPFMPARNLPSHSPTRYDSGEPFSRNDKANKPLAEPLNFTDKQSFSQFQRELSKTNDYKFDSLSLDSDPEDHVHEEKLVENEDLPFSYDDASQLGAAEFAAMNSSSFSDVKGKHLYLNDVEDAEIIPVNDVPDSMDRDERQAECIGYSPIETSNIDILLDPLLSLDERYAKQRSCRRVSFQLGESLSDIQPCDYGMKKSPVTDTYTGLTDVSPEQPITNRELIEDINAYETEEPLVPMNIDDDSVIFPSAFTQDDSFIGICTTHPVRETGLFAFSEGDPVNMNSTNTEGEIQAELVKVSSYISQSDEVFPLQHPFKETTGVTSTTKIEEISGVASFKSDGNSILEDNAGILEVVGQSVEDMHVLNKQTDSGCRNEPSIGKIKSHESVSNESSRIQVEPQTVKDPNAVLKEMERSLIDYSEDDAHQSLEVHSKICGDEETSFVPKHETEQNTEGTNKNMKFHKEVNEMEAKSVDGGMNIKDDPTDVQLECNMDIQSKPHEDYDVKTHSSQNIELSLEQFSEGIDDMTGKDSECSFERGSERHIEQQNMETQSDIHEEEAKQDTSTLEDICFEVGESQNQLLPSLEKESDLHEIIAGTPEELNLAIEQFDRQNTMHTLDEKYNKFEDVSLSIEKESDLHEIVAGSTEELNMAIEKFDRQNTMHFLDQEPNKSEDVSLSVEKESDLHEIVAGSTKELNIAIEKFDRQNTMHCLDQKHNKSEDVLPTVEKESDFDEIVEGTTKELNLGIEQLDRQNTIHSLDQKHNKSEHVSPSVKNDSDLHEIVAGSTEELNLAMEQFDGQNTMHSLDEKHNKFEDVPPSVKNDSDLHEIVAGSTEELNMGIEKFGRQYTSKHIECETSFEADENEKQMDLDMEMHPHMPEVKVSNVEELNMSMKQFDRQNTSQYIECKTSFDTDEIEKQTEHTVQIDSHMLENKMDDKVEVHSPKHAVELAPNTQESNMALKEFDRNKSSVLEKFIGSETLFGLDDVEDQVNPNVEMYSVMNKVETFPEEGSSEFEDAPLDFEQTEIHLNSDSKIKPAT